MSLSMCTAGLTPARARRPVCISAVQPCSVCIAALRPCSLVDQELGVVQRAAVLVHVVAQRQVAVEQRFGLAQEQQSVEGQESGARGFTREWLRQVAANLAWLVRAAWFSRQQGSEEESACAASRTAGATANMDERIASRSSRCSMQHALLSKLPAARPCRGLPG